jgi:hypothetical protein
MPSPTKCSNPEQNPLLDKSKSYNANIQLRDNGFDYEDFIKRMKHPSCQPFLEQIRRFIKDFENFPIIEQPKMFHRFHQRIWEKLMQTEAWQSSSAFDGINAREGLEYLLMNQLAEKAFRQTKEDRQNDDLISINFKAFSWLEARHLQSQPIIVPPIIGKKKFNGFCYLEFTDIENHRTPKDKLDTILKGCSRVKELVASSSTSDISADDLLPLFIIAFIKSGPINLASQLSYIQKFRDPQQLKSSDAYLLTHCLAASQFIKNLSLSELSFENEEEAVEKQLHVKEVLDRIRASEINRDPASPYSRTPSIEFSRLEDKATRVFGAVKQSQALKSIKKFFGEAQSTIREGIDGLDQIMTSHNDDEDGQFDAKAEKEIRIEEEFQIQLAMALSLSEQELLNPPKKSLPEITETWDCTKDFN